MDEHGPTHALAAREPELTLPTAFLLFFVQTHFWYSFKPFTFWLFYYLLSFSFYNTHNIFIFLARRRMRAPWQGCQTRRTRASERSWS